GGVRRVRRSVGHHRSRSRDRLRSEHPVRHLRIIEGPLMMPRSIETILSDLNLPARDAAELPASRKRFADGAQYRVEIPSWAGPSAMEAVVAEARDRSVPLHRVSQGSGIMLQTSDEIGRMVALGREHGIEVCLFVGPRANWDVGVQAQASLGRVIGSS